MSTVISRTRITSPVVASSKVRIEQAIGLKEVGRAMGVWAFEMHDEDRRGRKLQDAVVELTQSEDLSPHDSNAVWQAGRAMILSLECIHDIKEQKLEKEKGLRSGTTLGNTVGHVWDCHREMFDEVTEGVRQLEPEIAADMQEVAITKARNSSDAW